MEAGHPPERERDDMEALRQQVDDLQTMLSRRAPIEQAKGMLAAEFRIHPETAFTVLVDASQTLNVKLHDIAVAVVESVVADASARSRAMAELVRRLAAGHLHDTDPA